MYLVAAHALRSMFALAVLAVLAALTFDNAEAGSCTCSSCGKLSSKTCNVRSCVMRDGCIEKHNAP